MASETKISLKLLVDKKSKKVLFAEAGKDFVDFLFGLLQIPVGSIMGLLVEQGVAGSGSLGRVYESVQNLDRSYLQPNQDKDSLLRPEIASSSYCHTSPLLQNLVSKKQEYCEDEYLEDDCEIQYRVMDVFGNRVSRLVLDDEDSEDGSYGEVGYVKGMVTYMVMDDLMVKPMSTISSMTLINSFDIKDVGNLQEKTVVVDTKKASELLKASFESNTVLTDVFLGKKETARVPQSSASTSRLPAYY